MAELPPADRVDYDAICKAMAERFGQERLTLNYQLQLETRTQKAGESLTDLANDIERLVRGAFPGETLTKKSKTAVKSFVKALFDRELAKLITLTKPDTVQDPLSTALQLQSVTVPSNSLTATHDAQCWGCKGAPAKRRLLSC